ncbi:MAG: tRNA (N6-isopentenyl adenosine(37)-C2)-methylthiotransferase MiaB [Proteobacteria bacterium]|nr:tRNA (N6-isopentenyl adenosine(37)-C2)-methylthiotransferase MiaB [Pseudomonadota bacterium]
MENNEQKNTPEQKVFIKTYGCQMNEYDSEKMFQLLSNNYSRVEDINAANLVIVNTCSVREKGEHKLFSLLGGLRELKEKNPDLVLGVGGCVAQQEGENIIKRNSAVDFVVGTHNLSLIPSLIENVKSGRGSQVAIDYREDWESLPEVEQPLDAEGVLNFSSTPARALVAIQRGCNKKCAFCVVPTTRGPEVSRDAEEILREIKLKVRLGAKEVLLLGQTVNSYGRDLTPRYPFEDLIKRIAEIDGVARIRFTSPHPAEVKESFIKLYAEVPQLCPHIHLPLQSGSDRILKLMNRNYRIARYLEIVSNLKEIVPHIAITSDIIVGFPTETEEDYLASLDVMEKIRYSTVYSFKYSKRPNTKAIEQFKPEDEIPSDIASSRLTKLQALQDQHSHNFNKQFVDSEMEVLIESKTDSKAYSTEENSFKGRVIYNTPIEVVGDSIKVGDLLRVKIKRSSPYGLVGLKI